MNNQTSTAINTEELAANSYRQMIDYLEDLLKRQIEKLRKYDLDSAIVLAEEANNIAMTLGQASILDQPEYSDDKWRIQKLYKDLGLIIAAERQEVAVKLQAIRKGMRALGVYGDSV